MKLLKKYFIAHEGNNHQPHILRRRAVLMLAFFVLLAEMVFLFQRFVVVQRTGLFATILPSVLVEQTNAERIGGQVGTLSISPVLETAARLKAADMAAKGYFAHNTPEGYTPWYWFDKAGYKFSYAGENLAVNFSDSKDVSNAWMNSPTHRANILNGRFTEIGIATAVGTYQGREAVFVVQLFGTPKPTQSFLDIIPSAIAGVLPTAPPPPPAARPKPQPSPVPIKVTTTTAQTQETFIAVESNETSTLGATQSPREPDAPKAPNLRLLERLIASPKQHLNVFYTLLALLVLAAILMNTFLKLHVHHPRLILNGLLLLALIAIVVLFNQHVTLAQALVF